MYVFIALLEYLSGSDMHIMQDNYRIIKFEGPEFSADHIPFKTHLTLSDGPHRPSDRFLRLHFERCLTVSACGGDVREDYEEQEIDHFMEDLGIFDDAVDFSDPRWSTSLGREVHSFLLRDKLVQWVIFKFLIVISKQRTLRYADEELEM